MEKKSPTEATASSVMAASGSFAPVEMVAAEGGVSVSSNNKNDIDNNDKLIMIIIIIIVVVVVVIVAGSCSGSGSTFS